MSASGSRLGDHGLMNLRYAESCAGVGGFRLGIEASALDATPVYANEINAVCPSVIKSVCNDLAEAIRGIAR